MVDFLFFRVRNANPFRKVDLDLKRKGLVRLAGRNGAGKSSLWHLLTFLFYGISPNKAGKSDIAMDQKDFLLECRFQKNGIEYVAAMSAKSKCKSPTGEVYGTGYSFYRKDESGWIDISWHKALDTQKFVRDILGWSQEEWFGYVYLAQQTSHLLIMGTPGDRQKYLSAIFNLDPLDTIAEHYKQKALEHSESVQELDRKKHELDLLNQRLTAYTETCLTTIPQTVENIEQQIAVQKQLADTFALDADSTKAEHAKWVKLNELKSKLQTYGDYDPAELPNIRRRIEQLVAEQATVDVTLKGCRELSGKISTIDAKLSQLHGAGYLKRPDDFEQVLASPDISLAREEARLVELRNKERQVQGAPTAPPEIPDNMDDILASPDIDLVRTKREIDILKKRPAPPAMKRPTPEDLDELRMAVSNVRANVSFCHDRRAQLMMEGICPTCGTELNTEHRKLHFEKVDAELHEAEREQKKVNALLGDLESAERAWAQHDKLGPDRTHELPELEASVTRFEAKQQYLKIEQELERYVQAEQIRKEILEIHQLGESIAIYKLKQKYRKMEEMTRETKELERQREALVEEEKTLRKTIPETIPAYDMILHVERLAERNIQEAAAIQNQITELEAQDLQDMTDEIQHLEKCLAETQQQIGKLQEKLKEVRQAVQDRERLEKEIAAQESIYRQQKKCEILAKNFGKAGKIRQRHLKKFSGFLEEALLCHTYRLLPEHRFSIVVEDGIEIKTSKNGCLPYDIKMMSGAEKGAMSIAFLFALDDLLPPDRKTSLKIVDEIESAFDPARKQDFTDYMLPELRNRAETVIVISHTEMEDRNVFDRIWEVRNSEVLDVSGEVREFSNA